MRPTGTAIRSRRQSACRSRSPRRSQASQHVGEQSDLLLVREAEVGKLSVGGSVGQALGAEEQCDAQRGLALVPAQLVLGIDELELMATARGSCRTHSLIGNRQAAKAAAELAVACMVVEQYSRRAVRSFAVRLLEVLPLVLEPFVVDLDEDRGLVVEVPVERLRRVACAARGAVVARCRGAAAERFPRVAARRLRGGVESP